jgi:hypothetical protein
VDPTQAASGGGRHARPYRPPPPTLKTAQQQRSIRGAMPPMRNMEVAAAVARARAVVVATSRRSHRLPRRLVWLKEYVKSSGSMESGLSPASSHAVRGEMPQSGQLRSAAVQGSAGQAIPCLGRRRRCNCRLLIECSLGPFY